VEVEEYSGVRARVRVGREAWALVERGGEGEWYRER